MRLDEDRDALPSKKGAVCSLLLFFIISIYTLQKIDVLLNEKDVNIFSALAEGYFDSDYVFGAEQGLNIAVAVTDISYSLFEDQTIDPAYGRIRVLSSAWTLLLEKGEFEVSNTEIETHRCSMEELGLLGNDSKFMPVNQLQLNTLLAGAAYALCVDQS